MLGEVWPDSNKNIGDIGQQIRLDRWGIRVRWYETIKQKIYRRTDTCMIRTVYYTEERGTRKL